MPIVNQLNWRNPPFETNNRFAANFNAPIGQYGFQGAAVAAANTRQPIMPVFPQYIYLIDVLSFSASMDQSVWLEAYDDTDPVSIRLYLSDRETPIFPRAFPAIGYKQSLPLSYWFAVDRGRTTRVQGVETSQIDLEATITGTINQPAALVGVPTIYALLSLVIYAVEDQEEVRNLIRNTRRGSY